jgi:hypothetical protein
MYHFDQHPRRLVGALLDRRGPLISCVNAEGSDADKEGCRSNQEKYDDCRRLLLWLARRVSQNFSRLCLSY